MLLDFLIFVLIIVGVYIILRYALSYFLSQDPATLKVVLQILGIVAAIVLLLYVGSMIGGGANRFHIWR